MHGELIEFNDFLQRQLRTKDAVIDHLKQQLVHIRGPVRVRRIPSLCKFFVNRLKGLGSDFEITQVYSVPMFLVMIIHKILPYKKIHINSNSRLVPELCSYLIPS